MMKSKKMFVSILVILIASVITFFILFIYKKGDIVQNVKEADKESMDYKETEESEIKRLTSINVQPLNTNASETESIQLESVSAHVDTDIETSTENQGIYRSTYGIGEKVVLVASFNKPISGIQEVLIKIQFGEGDPIGIYGRMARNPENEIIFEHTLREDIDNGKLNIIELTGRVNGSEINWSQDKVSPNDIKADTVRPRFTSYNINISENKRYIVAEFVCDELAYNKTNNSLEMINDNLLKNLANVTFSYNDVKYKGRGQIESSACLITEDGKYKYTYVYKVDKGDFGKPTVWLKEISDIAGNGNGKDTGVIGSVDIQDEEFSEWHPDITSVSAIAEGNTYDDITYCKAGKTITIAVQWNEKVYADNIGTELPTENAKNINIKIGENIRKATFKNISSDGTVLYYEYTIQSGDNGDIENVVIPENIVYDNVGHGSGAEATISGNYNIIVDTTAPVVDSVSNLHYGKTMYKAESEIALNLIFSEDVNSGSVDITFSDNARDQSYKTNGTDEWIIEKTITHIIKSEVDNGKLKIQCRGFKDKAGNSSTEQEFNDVQVYADTTPPTIEVQQEKIDNDKIKYIFDLKDNSDQWDAPSKGVANNSFLEGDINVTGGEIIETEQDENGNINVINVLLGNDGMPKLYISKGAITDVVGNENEEVLYTNKDENNTDEDNKNDNNIDEDNKDNNNTDEDNKNDNNIDEDNNNNTDEDNKNDNNVDEDDKNNNNTDENNKNDSNIDEDDKKEDNTDNGNKDNNNDKNNAGNDNKFINSTSIKSESTTSNSKLPYAGEILNIIIISVAVLIVLFGVRGYVLYKKYKGI